MHYVYAIGVSSLDLLPGRIVVVLGILDDHKLTIIVAKRDIV